MDRVLSLLLAAALLPAPPAPAFPGDRDGTADPSPGGAPEDRITPEQQAAIDRGLAWLAGTQTASGAFPTRPAVGGNSKSADYQTAVTALSTLAFLGAGHGLRHGPYRETVRKSVQWLLQAQAGSSFPGFISFPGDGQSKMHGHGFATLALAEAYGTASSPERAETESRDPEEIELRKLSQALRRGIQAAVDCIESSQSSVGGWDYMPTRGGTSDHEGSVTVCQVQALLAASNRGFRVSLPRIQAAREYMKKTQSASGGFRYRLSSVEDPRGRGTESFALTAAGITSLLGLAEFDRKDALDRAFRYLDRAEKPDISGGSAYPFYGAFYGVQAFHWAGGERWKNFWLPLRRKILREQQEDGAWSGHDTQLDLGNAYPTAFCLLMLEVPVGYLSIYAK